MNKFIKWAALVVAAPVVIVLALAAYLAVTFDPNQYKPQIVQAVKDYTGRTLTLDGDIKLSFFPDIGATLGKASLSEHASDSAFAAADDFHVVLKLWPLLRREAVVDAIEATNLRARVIRFKDGKTNIDDLIGGARFAAARGADDSQVKVDIRRITIKNATIACADEVTGTRYVLSKLNLKTGRIGSAVPSKIELSFAAQSEKPTLNVDITLKTTVTFDLDPQRYALADLDLSASGLASGINNLTATAKGDIEVKPASNELLVSRLAVAASGIREGVKLNLKIGVPAFALNRDKLSADSIALEAVLDQNKSRLIAKFGVSGVYGSAQAFNASELTAALELQTAGATSNVRLTSPLSGSVDAEKIELPKVVAAIHVMNPELTKIPLNATFSASARVDFAKQNANLIFAARLDDSSINGRAGLTKFTHPRYTFDVNIDRFDADRYLPKSDPKRPFNLSALKALNASGSIKIGTLIMGSVKASNVRLDVTPADGRVDGTPIAAAGVPLPPTRSN